MSGELLEKMETPVTERRYRTEIGVFGILLTPNPESLIPVLRAEGGSVTSFV
jgi:hypothetical protein